MIQNYLQTNRSSQITEVSDVNTVKDGQKLLTTINSDLLEKLSAIRLGKRRRSIDLGLASSKSSSNSESESELGGEELCVSTSMTGKHRIEILRFLKWFDSLSDEEIMRQNMPLPSSIGLGEKALEMLQEEGYVIYYHHPSYRYLIRLHGSKEIPGTLDS